MKNNINYLQIILIATLIIILMFIINNIRPKITVLVLSYNRPENLKNCFLMYHLFQCPQVTIK